MLVNARHVKQVPGARPTSPMRPGCASSLRRACCGPASCRPSRSATLRNADPLSQARRSPSASARPNRLHKALEDTGIKLDCVATDILGVSPAARCSTRWSPARPTPSVLAELARGQLRAKLPALREALEGRFEPLARAADRGDPRAPRLPRRADRPALGRDRGAARALSEPAVELLCTIPGVGAAHRRAADRRDRHRHERLPDRRAPRLLGRAVPRQRPVRRQTPLAAAPARAPNGSTPRSRTPRWPPPAPTTATCKRSTAASGPSSGHEQSARRRQALDASAPAGTCSPPASSTHDLGGDYFARRDPERHTQRLVAQLPSQLEARFASITTSISSRTFSAPISPR